jgi:hypothetical protein
MRAIPDTSGNIRHHHSGGIRGFLGPPYWAAVRLLIWAAEHWSEINGRFILAGNGAIGGPARLADGDSGSRGRQADSADDAEEQAFPGISIPDFLDVCYVLIVDDLKSRLLVDRQIVGMAQVMGSDAELPDIDAELLAFNTWLISPPEESGETEESRTLKQALGLR